MTTQQFPGGIVAEGITLRLAGRTVLASAGLKVRRGELVGVVGPNGAGKSSLLKIAAGQRPMQQGSVEIDGAALAAWDRRRLARTLAYLPQERIVHWPISVEAVVALGRLPHGATASKLGAADTASVAAAITTMDLEALRHRPADALSGGELVRALIARTLAQEAPYILADEPVAGLDPAHQIALFTTLRKLADEDRGIAVALHDLTLAVRYCDRVLVLKDGRAVADGTPRAVLTPDLVRSVYGVEAFCGPVGGLPAVVPLSLRGCGGTPRMEGGAP